MSTFADGLGARTRRAADSTLPAAQRTRAEWDAEVENILVKVRSQCEARADDGYDNTSVDLFDIRLGNPAWTEPLMFGLNRSESFGTKLDYVKGVLHERLTKMGFQSMKLVDVGSFSSYRYVAELGWAVPERPSKLQRAASPKRGNLQAECGVCTQTKPVTALVPCGHVLCHDCAEKPGVCPFCRKAAEARQVLFKP
mmetsp:Transcript_74427/g.168606  ORF Transcript_74427/g.168606 Transcript_74427/m.168606 type:complete len:197 (+) Transcript_74427:87-677(+)